MKGCVCVRVRVCACTRTCFLGRGHCEGKEVGDSFACLRHVQGDLSE